MGKIPDVLKEEGIACYQLMPENYIIDRAKHEDKGDTEKWWTALNALPKAEYEEVVESIKIKNFEGVEQKSSNIKKVIEHYRRN